MSNKELLVEIQKMFDEKMGSGTRCPSCGHCPTCGHRPWGTLPSYPYYPFPYWQYIPTTTITTTGYSQATSNNLYITDVPQPTLTVTN